MKKVDIVIPDIFKHYTKVGEACSGPRVLVGECALVRRGLTSSLSEIMQLSTLHTGITGIWNPYVMWYFNPFADKYMYTDVSEQHPNILEPTEERALSEFIMLKEYFNEGILIEGLKNYISRHNDLSVLYKVSKDFKLSRDLIDHWINEAYLDTDEG